MAGFLAYANGIRLWSNFFCVCVCMQKRPRKGPEGSPSPNAKKRTNTFKASDILRLALSGPALMLELARLHSQDFVPEILATRSRAETATREFTEN